MSKVTVKPILYLSGLKHHLGFPGGANIKELACEMQETFKRAQVWSLGQEDPEERAWKSHGVLLTYMDGKAWLRQQSIEGCKERTQLKRLSTHTCKH